MGSVAPWQDSISGLPSFPAHAGWLSWPGGAYALNPLNLGMPAPAGLLSWLGGAYALDPLTPEPPVCGTQGAEQKRERDKASPK
jgi:hypothetical protein